MMIDDSGTSVEAKTGAVDSSFLSRLALTWAAEYIVISGCDSKILGYH